MFGALGRTPARGGEIDWTEAYERRMRRSKLEVIFAALIEGAGERFNWRPTEAGWGIMG